MKYAVVIAFVFTALTSYTQKSCVDCSCFKNHSLKWSAAVDDKGQEYLVRGDSLTLKSYSIGALFTSISNNYGINARLIKFTHNTAYVKILNTSYFTQKGYASVSWYLACLVYTLTEDSNCKKVLLDFIEGDHTGPPGYYTRENFKPRYVLCE